MFTAAARGRWRRAALAVAATVLVAGVGGSAAMLLLPTSDAPSPGSTTSAISSETEAPIASASPFLPSAWELRQLSLPPERARDSVAGVSPDGKTALVVEPTAFSSAHLIVSSGVRALVVPDHTQGAPIGAQLSRDGRFAILSELGQLWRYDVAAMTYTSLPSPHGSEGATSWTIAGNAQLLVLSGRIASFEFGGVTDTRLWSLDLDTLEYAPLGTRHDGIGVYPIAAGAAALLVDHSEQHDNTGWALYGILPDGSDELIYDIGMNFGPPSALAVAPDGRAIAFALPDGGTWLVEASATEARHVSGGQVIDFSPDSRQLRVVFPDDHVEAIDHEGAVLASLPGSATGWVHVPYASQRVPHRLACATTTRSSAGSAAWNASVPECESSATRPS